MAVVELLDNKLPTVLASDLVNGQFAQITRSDDESEVGEIIIVNVNMIVFLNGQHSWDKGLGYDTQVRILQKGEVIKITI